MSTPSAPAQPEPRIPRRHRLILVRHAHSAVDPQRPPSTWGLTEDGRAAAQRLAALGLFDRADAFYAGDEPKMVQTFEPVAAERERQVQVEPAFGETHSEGFLGSEQFLATIQRFLAEPQVAPAPGWETAAAARARFGAAVERLRAVHEPPMNRDRVLPATVAIATGGRMITSYLAGVLGWSAEEALDRWRALRMPDLAVLELEEDGKGSLVIPFGTLMV
jgi:broad specificity phosphatase PhoE